MKTADQIDRLLSVAAIRRTPEARYSQAQLDALVGAHERFLAGQPGGFRAIMRFLQAPERDFSNRTLANADLTGANLVKARLVGANLERATLFCADLLGVDARRANLRRADLRGSSLKYANLSQAMMEGIDLRSAVLARAEAESGFQLAGRSMDCTGDDGAVSFSVDLSNALLKNALLGEARLRNANFAGAVLTGADFRGADIAGSSFKGAVLTGVRIASLNVPASALEGAVMDPTREAIEAADELIGRLARSREWVRSGGVAGAPAVLDGRDLRPLSHAFARAELTAMSARSVCGIGVDFRGAHLQGACFDEADLRDADFSEADLRGATFRHANLWHAKFDGADLRALSLTKGRSRAVDMRDSMFMGDSLATAILA